MKLLTAIIRDIFQKGKQSMTKKQQNKVINELGLTVRRLNDLKTTLKVANAGGNQFDFTTSSALSDKVDDLEAVIGSISNIVYQKGKRNKMDFEKGKSV